MSLLVGFAFAMTTLFGGSAGGEACLDGASLATTSLATVVGPGVLAGESFEAGSAEVEDFVILEGIEAPGHHYDYGPLGERTESQREPEVDDDSESSERIWVLLSLGARVTFWVEPPPVEADTAPHEDSHLATVRSPRGPPLA